MLGSNTLATVAMFVRRALNKPWKASQFRDKGAAVPAHDAAEENAV